MVEREAQIPHLYAGSDGTHPFQQKYPLDDVIKDCLSGLVEINENREETVRKYFTSTFAYMMGLAIHEKFDVIELYGIDMENNTEYGYQRPCGEFWIGLALGRGIKVTLPEPCLLCQAPLYGYEIVPYVDVNRLKRSTGYINCDTTNYM